MSEFLKVTIDDENGANYYYPNTTGQYEFSGKTFQGMPYYTHKVKDDSDTLLGTTYYLYYHKSKVNSRIPSVNILKILYNSPLHDEC